jgi:hypothetical protein
MLCRRARLTVMECALRLLFLQNASVFPQRRDFGRMRVGQAGYMRVMRRSQATKLCLEGRNSVVLGCNGRLQILNLLAAGGRSGSRSGRSAKLSKISIHSLSRETFRGGELFLTWVPLDTSS